MKEIKDADISVIISSAKVNEHEGILGLLNLICEEHLNKYVSFLTNVLRTILTIQLQELYASTTIRLLGSTLMQNITVSQNCLKGI